MDECDTSCRCRAWADTIKDYDDDDDDARI